MPLFLKSGFSLDSDAYSCKNSSMNDTDFSENSGISWFRQSFGDLYPLIYSHRNSEAADREIRALCNWIDLKPGCKVLDSCCGNGRHLTALLEFGCDGYGFDLSEELIVQAAGDPGLERRLCRGDIRDIPFKTCFDVVLNLFTSFGYFQEDEENRLALSELTRCLIPGGLLVLDHMNAARVRSTLVRESECIRRGMKVLQQRWLRGNRVQKRIQITNSLGDQSVFREDVRLFEPDEMIDTARAAGLVDITLHGGFDGVSFESGSERMILIARRS